MPEWMIGPISVWVFALLLCAFALWQKLKLEKYEREHPEARDRD